MTKIIILGDAAPKQPKKPIEFTDALNHNKDIETAIDKPEQWENIELISKGYSYQFDLMFAFDDDRSKGCLFLGHFNDGVVE